MNNKTLTEKLEFILEAKGKHGEEAEEIQAALPYKGKREKGAKRRTTIYKAGSKDVPEGERETLPHSSSRQKTIDAPHGHQIPTRQAKKALAQARARGAREVPEKELTGQGDTKPGGKYLDAEGRAKRAKAHGRESEKQTVQYQKDLEKAVKAGKVPPSTAVQMSTGKKHQTGGRTRHAAGGNVHDVVSARWERKWADSATRRHAAEKSGRLETIRKRLAAQGKKMREGVEKIEFIKTFLDEGVQKTLRQSVQAVKASTKEVPGYAPGDIMGKNPYATKLKRQIKSGKERAAKRKNPATLPSKGGGNLRSPALGTDIAVLNALKKLKKKPRIEIEKETK